MSIHSSNKFLFWWHWTTSGWLFFHEVGGHSVCYPDKRVEKVKIGMPVQAVFMITRKMPRLHSSSHLLTPLIKLAQCHGCLQFVR
jgi:hypothetical protein